jgi:hypothetical protein
MVVHVVEQECTALTGPPIVAWPRLTEMTILYPKRRWRRCGDRETPAGAVPSAVALGSEVRPAKVARPGSTPQGTPALTLDLHPARSPLNRHAVVRPPPGAGERAPSHITAMNGHIYDQDLPIHHELPPLRPRLLHPRRAVHRGQAAAPYPRTAPHQPPARPVDRPASLP